MGAWRVGHRDRFLDWLAAYADAGGNFLDTANNYGQWHGDAGESERVIGRWRRARGLTDEVVVATKVRWQVSDPPGQGLAPDRIRAACDASLRRLGADVIETMRGEGYRIAVP